MEHDDAGGIITKNNKEEESISNRAMPSKTSAATNSNQPTSNPHIICS
jgi:hypothetical protein